MNKDHQLLQEAAQEIKNLRQHNAQMSLRLQMFDDMMMLFTTEPNFKSQGMSEDLAWKIEKYLEAEKQLNH